MQNRQPVDLAPAPVTRGALDLGITQLQVFVAVFEFVVGTQMLISPHLYTGPVYVVFRQNPTLWGIGFVLAAAGLAAALLLVRSGTAFHLLNVASGVMLLLFAYGFVGVALIGALTYIILGLGMLAVPWLRGTWSRHWFSLVVGAIALAAGTHLLVLPELFIAVQGESARPALLWLGTGFLISAAALFVAGLPGRARVRLTAYVLGAAPFFAYLLLFSLPRRLWSGIVFYGLVSALLAVWPFITSRIPPLDLTSLRARLALVLAIVAIVPMLLVPTLVIGAQEQAALANALHAQLSMADVASGKVHDFIRYHRASLMGLALQPELLEAASAVQQSALRGVQVSYPDFHTLSIIDPEGNEIARSTDGALVSAYGTPLDQLISSTLRPQVSLQTSPISQEPILALGVPVMDANNRIKGYVAAEVAVAELVDLVKQLGVTLDTAVYLVDGQGSVIAAGNPLPGASTDLSSIASLAALVQGPAARGSISFGDVTNRRVAAYSRLPETSWGIVVEAQESSLLAQYRRLRDAIFPLMLLAAILAWVVGLGVSTSMVTPLRSVIRAIGGVASGDLNVRLPSTSLSELRQLTESVGVMSRSLASASAERERLLAEVQRRAAELEASNKELEAFAYSVSHDLRAPLRGIDGFSLALLEDCAGQLDAEGQGYLRLVRQNAQRMGQLIDDLLAFSRLGRQSLQTQAVRLEEVVQHVWEDLRPEWADRQVELRVNRLPICQADPALLRQVYHNLLSNGLKFTRPRSPAIIEVGSQEQDDGEAVFCVKDNGVGFDMQYVDKVFGVFQRLHRAEEYEGTGVGLAIVQRIIQRHGGRVWAESQPGAGAAFYFTLGGTSSERHE